MILAPQTIRRLNILTPCLAKGVFDGCSYGLSSCSYDLRIAEDIVLWPGHAVNVDAIETFEMPEDVVGLICIKSTWARRHVDAFGTVVDPGFCGVLRLELKMSRVPLTLSRLYGQVRAWLRRRPYRDPETIEIRAGTSVVQVLFVRTDEPTETPYRGKYFQQGYNQDDIYEE